MIRKKARREILNYDDLLEIRPGGFLDTVMLLSLLSPAIAAFPWFGTVPYVLSFVAATVGAWWWSMRINQTRRLPVLDSKFYIEPSEPPRMKPGAESINLGVIVETGEKLNVSYDSFVRHMTIAGQSGYGKTVFAEYLVAQHVARGGGVIFIDGKIDADNKERMKKIAAWAGRLHELYIIDSGMPEVSNTINPILNQDPDEAASSLVSMIPTTESNPGADFYRNETTYGLTSLFHAIRATGRAYSITDVAVLLQSDKALEELYNMIPDSAVREKAQFALFLDKYRGPSKDGMPGKIDVKRLKETFGGMAGRLYNLGQGNFGKITNDYTPDVDLDDIIMNNKLLYVALETMGKQEAALSFAKILIGSMRTTIGRLQRLPKHQRPWPPVMVIMDEAGSYLTPSINRVFEQARSAGIAMIPAFQTSEQLESVDPLLKEGTLVNTEINVFFKVGNQKTSEEIAEILDKEIKKQRTIAYGSTEGMTRMPGIEALPVGSTDSESFSYSEREVEDYRVPTKVFKNIDIGEAIVLIEKNKVYHIRVPVLDLDAINLPEGSELPVRPVGKPNVKGLNLNDPATIGEMLGMEFGGSEYY